MDDGDEEESDLTSISCMVGRLAFMNSLVLLRLAVTHLLQNRETLLFHSPVVCLKQKTVRELIHRIEKREISNAKIIL